MLRAIIIFFFIMPLSALASNYPLNKIWSDNQGEHSLAIEKGVYKNSNGEYLLVKQTTNGKVDWLLNDYVKDCDVDIVLDIVSESLEIKKWSPSDEGIVLFAYKIGCIGGVDPVTVKYFAYSHGIKYALRGEEHIIIGEDSYGGENPPVADFNLKHNKQLYDYMLSKWKVVSLRTY